MNISLNLKERILLPLLLKDTIQQGNMIEMLGVHQILEKIKITEQEIIELNIKGDDNGNVTWDDTKENTIQYNFSVPQVNILIKASEICDKNKLVTLQNVFLIQKLLQLKEEI